MPKVSDIFSNGPFLRAADLKGPLDVAIAGWREEYLFGKNEFVLDLDGEPLALRLTQTLARDIKAALNDEDDLDNWIGGVVTLYPNQMKIRDKGNGEEKLVNTIRAKALNRDTAKALKNPLDDDIPF